ncbi:MAG: dTDP-glucose 4,6-dehydratase, partial [Elusimicrobia bacterium RIFOXYB2_FULL_48_7]
IVEYWQNRQGARVLVLDNLKTGFRNNIEGFNVKFIRGSVTDYKTVLEASKGADYIFHLAAMISVPESIINPVECFRINTEGTLNIIKAARENKVKKIILSSSSAIYGDNPKMPKAETMLPEPKSPYAVSKLDGEYLLSLYRKAWGVESVSCRYFNVFGPRQNPKSQYAAAVPIFIFQALRNKPLTVFGDGRQTRDFIYVKDVVQANVLACKKGEGVYNAAYGTRITINELAKKVIQMCGSSSKIIHAKERPGDIKHSLADISRIKQIGFKPGLSLDEGLKATIEYFKAQPRR